MKDPHTGKPSMDALNRDIQDERLTGSQRRRPLPILEKKLDELESQLQDFFLQTPAKDPISASLPDLNHLRRAKIEAKIEFIKNLLTREMEPHAPSTPEQLSYTDRLAALEDSYHHHHIDNMASSDDEHSTCSCTQSCLAEGEEYDIQGLEAAAASVPESQIVLAPPSQESKKASVPESEIVAAPSQESKKYVRVTETQERSGVWSKHYIMSMAVAIVVTVGAVVMNFCMVDDSGFVPT